jgi:cytidylate kinase
MDHREQSSTLLRRFIITIDGPAGSGKSTTAARLAGMFGLIYLDTGAMYRAVTLAAIERGIDPEDGAAVSALAAGVSIELRGTGAGASIFLDGRNVDAAIRTPAVSRAVSPVSRHEGVRRSLVTLQRRLGAAGGVVAEGRDTGTVVFPHAAVKVFLVADIDARVARRREQLRGMGIPASDDEIRENIRSRDAMDAGRRASPLRKPAGAFVVDTSRITIDEQVSLVAALVRREADRIAAIALAPGERDRLSRPRGLFAVSQLLVRCVFRAVFGLRIAGRDRLRYRENYLFASNHRSYADPLVVGCALPRPVWFLAKKELFANRLFAWLIRSYHAIPVDRGEIELATMKRLFGLLGAGESLLMFPEGTRARGSELLPLKAGLGFTALRSRTTVVPVYVSGTDRLGACLLRRSRLSVRIGYPIRAGEGNGRADRKDEYLVLTDMVRSAIGMLRDETEA